jgi:hypothetical protein
MSDNAPGHDPRLDMGRAALIAQLDEARAEIERLEGLFALAVLRSEQP